MKFFLRAAVYTAPFWGAGAAASLLLWVWLPEGHALRYAHVFLWPLVVWLVRREARELAREDRLRRLHRVSFRPVPAQRPAKNGRPLYQTDEE